MGSIPTRSRHPGVVPARVPTAPTAALLALLVAGVGPARAQEPSPADTAAAARDTAAVADTTPTTGDTLGAAREGVPGLQGPPAQPDTTPGPPVSPLGAFARSLVLPGWGQAVVDRPVRGAVYFAAEAASLWMVFKTQTKLSAAERGTASDTAALVESRTGQREDWIVLSAFFALMSGVDAWVSAHLYGFEGRLEPPSDGTAGAQVSYSVPLDLP